jgi:putative molybdopterin biosynthesis protein
MRANGRRDIYTLQEAAHMLRVSDDTMYRAIKRGEIEAQKVGRQWRIDGQDLYNRPSQSRSNRQK